MKPFTFSRPEHIAHRARAEETMRDRMAIPAVPGGNLSDRLRGLCMLIVLDRFNSTADPLHDGHRHRIAERLVSRSVGGRLAAPLDRREIVGKALQPLAFAGRQAADGHINGNCRVPARVRMASAVRHAPERRVTAVGRPLDLGALAIERDRRGMRTGGERMTWIAGPRRAVVAWRRNLRRIKRHRHQRRASPRPVLARVEALAPQGMGDKMGFAAVLIAVMIGRDQGGGDEGFRLEILSAVRPAMGRQARRNLDRAACPVAAKGD